MSALLVSAQEIRQYIPQQDPIVMIDGIVSCDGLSIVCCLTISAENIFVKEGFLQTPGVIENMAQTAAARAGYEARKKGEAPLPGFIGAIKDLQIFELPAINEHLITQVDITNEVMGVTIIRAQSRVADKPIATCEMKIFIQQTNASS
jgi:predicted hotdog family 3-hydroxylacyl-ACP dehydratase